jgi:XrtJ-associated TM-motif-TM protein
MHILRKIQEHCSDIVPLILAFCIVPAAHAQSGCVNSPESPTAVLALVGVAAGALTAVRVRLRAKQR